MLKVKFKNGINGFLTDWTPYMVIQEVGSLKRSVESENPGEAGLIVYDNVSLTFRYEEGNVVYDAFSGSLNEAQIYLFEIFAVKSDKSEIKIFEGIADFSTLEWDLNELTLRFDVVDKLKALDMLTDSAAQRGEINDIINRINCTDYLTDIIKRSITGMGVWLEIQTYHLINNEGNLERGDAIIHTETILKKGETFLHPAEGVGLCLVTDSELMTSMGGWITTFVKIHPLKSCTLTLPLAEEDSTIVVSGNIFEENDIVYLENAGQIEFLKILDAGFGSDVSWIYSVERHYTGETSFNWNTGEIIKYSDINHTYITNLSSPPVSTHLFYYANQYYNSPDINITGYDSFGRNVLKAFDAIKILNAIVSRVLSPVIFCNRTGENTYPVSLNYYNKLYDASPFGKHSLEAVKLLADSMRCYIFIDREGTFVIQKKSNLGAVNAGLERNFDAVRLSAASVPRKFFWDKLIDGVQAKIISDGFLSAGASKQIFQNIKPRNELNKEIVALNTILFNKKSLADYALEAADDYLSFYGKRHDSYSLSMSLYDSLLEWELLDYITFDGKKCFFASFEIDLAEREFRTEMISIPGENYYKGQANIPLSIEKYSLSSNGGGPEINSGVTVTQAMGSAMYSAEEPLEIGSAIISLGYENNLKLSSNNKLDTIQGIKTTSIPRFDGIAIGGDADILYKGKFYGDVKVTGKIVVDGDLNISGSLNEVNLTELYVADKTINLNKGGSYSTAPGSGLRVLGTSGIIAASISYDADDNWSFDKSINLPAEKRIKINGIDVLTSDTLGNGILNSSLTKVGIIASGTWKGSPVNAQYINYDSTNFQNVENKLTSKTITAGSINGVAVSGTFYPGGVISIDTPQDIRITASPAFNNITLNNGVINSGADLTINLSGSSILPQTGYAYNIGSLNKKYLSLHAAELCVESLVAQNTKATIGGRVLIGEANELTADINQTNYYINVKYNNLASNDIIYFESAGRVEFMKVIALTASSGGSYEYQVQRAYDGTAANNWYAGDSLFNTGGQGDGFIDLYSIKGIKGSVQPGPTMTGNVRNSLVYNDWSEHWAIGNLNGLYGFTSNAFGVGLGRFANNSSYITLDPQNGFAIKHKDNTGAEIKVIELDASGNGYFRGNITSSAVITGGTLQTAITGKRVKIDGAGNDIKFFNNAGEYISVEGYLSAQNEKRLRIGGALMGEGDLNVVGGGVFGGNIKTSLDIDSLGGYKIDGTSVIDENSNAVLNNIDAGNISLTKLILSGYDLITARPAASKILITDTDRKIVNSDIPAGELFTPAFCELYDESADSTITCDGSTYVKWTNSSIGVHKSIQGNVSSDSIIIDSGFQGKYLAHYDVSFLTGNAADYYWSLKVGSSITAGSRSCVKAQTYSLTHVSGGCLLDLAAGDQISIGCLGTANTVLTVTYLNVRIVKISN